MMLESKTHSVEIEQKLLGGILAGYFDPALVLAELTPEFFYQPTHQHIFAVIKHCVEQNTKPDIVSVPETANDLSLYTHVGGKTYINDLAIAAMPHGLEYYLDVIKDKFIKRDLILACEQVAYELSPDCPDETPSAIDFIQNLRNFLDNASKIGYKGKEFTNEQLKAKALAEIERKLKGELLGLPTGFKSMDRVLDGFSEGELIILAARPGMGKTSLAINIASNVADKKPVLFFTLEMPSHQIIKRVVVGMAESKSNMVKLRSMHPPDNLRVLDASGIGLEKIRAAISKYRAVYGELGLVVVDHLGLVQVKGSNAYERTKQVSNGLKGIALEFNLPVLALAQLSRATETREDKRPKMSDLRDSGDIEQDADKIIFLFREKYYDPSASSGVDVGLAKNRNGETGSCRLDFREEITKFYDLGD